METACPARTNSSVGPDIPAVGRCASLLPLRLRRSSGRRRPQQPVGRIDNDEALEGALPALSNWGRWGEDDQLGTLNLIIPQTRLAAAS